MKLPLSRSIALQLPDSQPTPYGLGKSGWVSLSFETHAPPPLAQLEEWLDESYCAQAPKKLLAEFEARRGAPARPRGAARRGESRRRRA